VCCSVLQCVAVCCSVIYEETFQMDRALREIMLLIGKPRGRSIMISIGPCLEYDLRLVCVAVCCNVLQCVAACWCVLQRVAACCSMLHGFRI